VEQNYDKVMSKRRSVTAEWKSVDGIAVIEDATIEDQMFLRQLARIDGERESGGEGRVCT
jgi:hypothetical protein